MPDLAPIVGVDTKGDIAETETMRRACRTFTKWRR
jgi:hypothetical protein